MKNVNHWEVFDALLRSSVVRTNLFSLLLLLFNSNRLLNVTSTQVNLLARS
jgi:hypothetical protein